MECIGFYWSLVVSIISALLYVYYISEIRETDLWWSNMDVLEKEISYRTEQGLYYSYYKHLVESENLMAGIYRLTRDEFTEAPEAINIFERMNIAPELLLALFQRISYKFSPIDFYDRSVIRLQSLTPFALSLVTWIVTDNFLSTIPFAVLFLLNHHAVSRVEFALPLRENFALPLWWLRMAFLSVVIKSPVRLFPVSRARALLLAALAFTTASFCVVWQFSQFVLLLESGLLLIFQHFALLREDQCLVIASAGLLGLFCTCIAQAGNLFPFASPCAVALLTAIIWIRLKRCYTNRLRNVPKTVEHSWGSIYLKAFKSLKFVFKNSPFALGPIAIKFGLIISLFVLTRLIVPNEDASHIVPFVRQKLNMWPRWEFHSALYLCSGAFQIMDMQKYWASEILPNSWLFLAYLIGVCSLFPFRSIWISTPFRKLFPVRIRRIIKFRKSKQAEPTKQTPSSNLLSVHQLWHLAINIIYGLLAWSTLRMKYLWTPHMLVIATHGLTVFLTNISNQVSRLWFWMISSKSAPTSSNPVASPLEARRVKQTMSPSCDNSIQLEARRRQREKLSRDLAVVSILLLSLIFGLKTSKILYARLSELKEFHDPDTVNLMNWIKREVHPKAIFAGSMQLMAAVKLCTGRPIANHPHYEHSQLRERTRKIYQVYGRKSWIEVYRILVNHSISHIILENSICFASSNGCEVKDLVDLDNYEWPDNITSRNARNVTDGLHTDYYLDEDRRKRIRYPANVSRRFCDLLIHSSVISSPHYSSLEKRRINRYFKLVYQDSTFNVFQVNTGVPA